MLQKHFSSSLICLLLIQFELTDYLNISILTKDLVRVYRSWISFYGQIKLSLRLKCCSDILFANWSDVGVGDCVLVG